MGWTADQFASLIDGIRLDSSHGGSALAGVVQKPAKTAQPRHRSAPARVDEERPQFTSTRPTLRFPEPALLRRQQASADLSSPALDPTLPAAAFRGPPTAARSNSY
jgi:hypothetical protein